MIATSYTIRLAVGFSAVVASILLFAQTAQATTFGIPEVAGTDMDEVQPPANIRLVESTKTTVEVAWTSDVRSILLEQTTVATQYTVRVYDKKSGERLMTLETNEMSVVVEGLEVNHGYVVKVWASREGFTSDPSELVVRTSPPAPRILSATIVRRQIHHDVVTNAPLNQFGGSSMSKFLAYLSWDDPKGTVRSYTVKVYKKNGDESIKSIETQKLSVGVGGLKLNRVYEYTVTAHFNDDYASESSERVRFEVSREAVE